MRNREEQVAERFGILERCKAFESDLLKIKDIVPSESDHGVCFDLDSFLSDMWCVIIVPKYDIRANRNDYWKARSDLRVSVIELAERYDLHRTGDPIEDYGEHFYFVFSCGASWKQKARTDK